MSNIVYVDTSQGSVIITWILWAWIPCAWILCTWILRHNYCARGYFARGNEYVLRRHKYVGYFCDHDGFLLKSVINTRTRVEIYNIHPWHGRYSPVMRSVCQRFIRRRIWRYNFLIHQLWLINYRGINASVSWYGSMYSSVHKLNDEYSECVLMWSVHKKYHDNVEIWLETCIQWNMKDILLQYSRWYFSLCTNFEWNMYWVKLELKWNMYWSETCIEWNLYFTATCSGTCIEWNMKDVLFQGVTLIFFIVYEFWVKHVLSETWIEVKRVLKWNMYWVKHGTHITSRLTTHSLHVVFFMLILSISESSSDTCHI